MFQAEGLDSAGSGWGSGSAWGGYNEEALVSGARGRHGGETGRQGVRGPGGHWRVCSVELMTDRCCKATLQLVFPRDFGGGGVGWGGVGWTVWQGGQF